MKQWPLVALMKSSNNETNVFCLTVLPIALSCRLSKFSFYFILLFFRVLPYCAIVLPFWLIAISAKARKTARMPNSFYCITWKLKSIGGTCRIMKKISKDRVKEISVWNIHNCILWWCYMRFKFENFDVQVTHLHPKLREDFAITLYPALSA